MQDDVVVDGSREIEQKIQAAGLGVELLVAPGGSAFRLDQDDVTLGTIKELQGALGEGTLVEADPQGDLLAQIEGGARRRLVVGDPIVRLKVGRGTRLLLRLVRGR